MMRDGCQVDRGTSHGLQITDKIFNDDWVV